MLNRETVVVPTPENYQAEILCQLLFGNIISEKSFTFTSFRARLTEVRRALLDKGIFVQWQWEEFINAHGRTGQYKKYYLLDIDIPSAIEVYHSINHSQNANISN